MLSGATSPGGDDVLCVTVVADEHGYGMKVSGDNPVYVQSVKENGAAWRAGLRAGDRILCVDTVAVHNHTHQQVVQMIRANKKTVLTVQQNTSRHKRPITAPFPVNPEKQRELEVSKVETMQRMLDEDQVYIKQLRLELSKVPDVRKQAQLDLAEQRCIKVKHEIDVIKAGQPMETTTSHPAFMPATPRLATRIKNNDKTSPVQNTGFLSGLPRSLSNLTGQSLRNLRQAKQNNKIQQENQPPLVRQNSDESNNKRRHVHNNTVPMVPTTCLDNVTPPPLPPRSIERPKRTPLSPPINPLAKPKPSSSISPMHKQYYKGRYYPEKPQYPMHQSMPAYNDEHQKQFRRSSHSLDGDLDGPQPNSIALQMSYPLVNVPPPPLQTDNRTGVPVLHVRSRSSPEQLDHELQRPAAPLPAEAVSWGGAPAAPAPPPPGTPPPPYATNTQPCADPQRAIISMEEDDSPASDNSTYSGLFSNLRSVRESKARTAVLLNWLLGERRSAHAALVLVLTDGFRAATAVNNATLRRWAYEIHSTFIMPNAVLQLNGVDENMANEIEQVLVNEYDKDEILRNVFRKARQKAKEEMTQQLTEFQVKRQVGLGTLYGPEDSVIEKCDVDKAQEAVVVERLLCPRLRSLASPPAAPGAPAALLAAAAAAAALLCSPTAVAAAVGGSRSSFLQRDKVYKQKVKQLSKQHLNPLVVRGHHLQLHALTSVAHCHHCDNVIWGLAPQAYVCTYCELRVHRACAKSVEEGCCLDGEHHNNRISRFMERIHPNNQPNNQDSNEKKFRKASGAAHFINMERSFRKMEDEPNWDQTLTPTNAQERRDESDESLYESADCHSDAISASDDALPRLSKTPTMSKESLKLAVTDEEVDLVKNKKGHRKTMSLSNPLEIVKSLGDEWLDATKKELDKYSEKKKSRESLFSEEDRESIHGSTIKLDQTRKNSKKEDKSQSSSRKSSTTEAPKTRKSSKGSSVSALNFLRRKKTPTSLKPVESVAEVNDNIISTEEILNYTRLFLEEEKHHAAISQSKPVVDTDSDEEPPTPKLIGEHRRRLSRQTSRGKSKVRGKSQNLKINTLRKSHSGTLKKGKKKNPKTPVAGRSRQASIVEQTPLIKKKNSDSHKHNSWLFSGSKGEARREGSTEEQTAPDADVDTSDPNTKEAPDKDNNWRAAASSGRGVNRAESCRERDAPRRGKHRNASDPNRLTAHNNHDLEPCATTAPSGSSSSSSLSSRSNESNTVAAAPDQQASQSDWSEEDEHLAAQWADSLPPHVLESLKLSSAMRKRQEVIHELIVSEGSHVRWLKVLGGVFLRPLESHPALLSPDELRALFPNLPSVRERHARLYSELRALRNDTPSHLVQIRPLADAMLNTLGESGYSSCLARFCRGQRLALESLRERRKKNKDLHQFLSSREQLPLCGRLQLRDLLACVWQRLTKYQLLLEGVLKTVGENDDENEEDLARLKRALDVAKDVLHTVDTAIHTAENEHRLRAIQSKLEVRAPATGEWDELRRLELTQRRLRHEGELFIRSDTNKKIAVLALMLEDSLVLLQREGEKFVLKPIQVRADPSQPGSLSPLIKWDKVLFRPNAAVRNTFFLMNINGVQMHELSVNNLTDYATWVKHIQESPLAKLAETKPNITPSHQASRSNDDSGINVSRNPSDASEKSTSTAPADEPTEIERDRASLERSSVERDKDDKKTEREDRRSSEKEGEVAEREEKHVPRRPTVGRISTHCGSPRPLECGAALTVRAPAAPRTAHAVCTPQERLRRLDEVIARALRAKSSVVGSLLGVPASQFAQVAELAAAEAQGELGAADDDHVHQLLLAAHAQLHRLTLQVSRAMTLGDAAAVAARARLGACDDCAARPAPGRAGHAGHVPPGHAGHVPSSPPAPAGHPGHAGPRRTLARTSTIRSEDNMEPPSESEERFDETDFKISESMSIIDSIDRELSFDMLTDLDGSMDVLEDDPEDALESGAGAGAALTGARLASGLGALGGTLGRLMATLPARERERTLLRRQLAAQREVNDRLHHAQVSQIPEEISVAKPPTDQSIQDQPSNGG